MTIKDANELELDTSDSTEILDEVTEPLEGGEVTDASSSAATDENDGSPLSVVRDVVGARKDATAASSAEGSEGGTTADGKEPKEPDNEEFSDVPFHKHPRFQGLIRERNELRPDAERYRNVQNFLDSSGLSSEEAANGLATMARAKVDPAGAWEEIKPWVQKLLHAAGEVLPDDLAQRVTAGELTQETALEVSRSRAKSTAVDTRTSFEQQQRDRRDQSALGTSLMTAATDWEKDRLAKDPNFAAKIVPLQKEIAWLHSQEGKPKTPEGVRDQLKRAYEAVNKQIKPAAPIPVRTAKPAVRPVTGGQVAGNVRPAPKSTLDIIKANRRTA